jgi:hypothetical protein
MCIRSVLRRLTIMSWSDVKLMRYICCALFFMIPLSAWGQERSYVHRGLFFNNRPFGALAWIDAQTKTAAKGREFVYDLSQSSCQSLPARNTYWFLINHRDPNEAANVGFFAVRIVGQTTGAPYEALRINRNDGWVNDDGKSLGAGPPEDNQLSLSIGEFVKLHDDNARPAMPAKQRLADLTERVGIWHARPEANMRSSWEYRRIFASSRHLNDNQGGRAVLLGARLMKFSVTDTSVTADPVIFYVNRGDLDAFWISVFAPNLGFEGIERQIRIDSPCGNRP